MTARTEALERVAEAVRAYLNWWSGLLPTEEPMARALAALDALPAEDDGWQPIKTAAIAWFEAGQRLSTAVGAAKLDANRAYTEAQVKLRATIKNTVFAPPAAVPTDD